MSIPEILFGQRIRVCSDGTYLLARSNVSVERFLDKELVRITNELHWRPKEVVKETMSWKVTVPTKTVVPTKKESNMSHDYSGNVIGSTY